LETVQKLGKIVDVYFFENVAFEKNLPVIIEKIPKAYAYLEGYHY